MMVQWEKHGNKIENHSINAGRMWEKKTKEILERSIDDVWKVKRVSERVASTMLDSWEDLWA